MFFFSLTGVSLFYFMIPLPDPLFEKDYSTVIMDKDDQLLRVFLNNAEQWCFPPDPAAVIPEKLRIAVLHFEDKYFYQHPGINLFSIFRAVFQNLSSGKIRSGASTITMQLARLMRDKPRTYLNKVLEMLQALKIEFKYSKGSILRLYLDHAPYGGNIIGYQAASLRYFNRLAEKLTWGQAATLAVLPNAPGLISPQSNPLQLRKKRNLLLRRLYLENIIDDNIYQLACLEEIPCQSIPQAFNAPHLARLLKSQGHEPSVIRTTIAKKIQVQAEELAAVHGEFLANLGIENVAVLVVETESGKVRAYVGSDDFFDESAQGQVDGVQAARSSGSILKPFLYALCMDEGLILPASMIKDIPSYYGSFSPANADMHYRGMVPAREALIHSLNVPSVRLLFKYGYQPFYHFLKKAGLRSLFRHYDDYGLPIILGGAETSLWDMAVLYRSLARYGKFEPIQVETKQLQTDREGRQLISPGASFLTISILSELKRPGAQYYWNQYQNQWRLAWKTGTSYGQRDGWAIGVSPQWTIAVWTGNFDGHGNANLSGASCAGPLLFDIFNMLPKDANNTWFIRPEDDLRAIFLCKQTGFLAGDCCPETVVSDAPRFMKPLQKCRYHQRLFVNLSHTEQLCSLCWENEEVDIQTRLIFPADVSQYLRQNGYPLESAPAHKASCPAVSGNNPLQIVYPQENASLWIPRDFGGKRQKVNCRVAHQQKRCRIYWYLDNSYRGISQEKHELALELTRGWHELEVIDESGNRKRVRFFANLHQ